MFEEELDVDETLSQLLVAEGFAELEEVAYVELAELAGIEGFDEELARGAAEPRAGSARAAGRGASRRAPRARRRGRAGRNPAPDRADAGRARQGRDQDARRSRRSRDRRADRQEARGAAPPQTPKPVRRCAATSATEDKGGVLGEFGLSEEQGNEIIMAARAHWFEDEEAPSCPRPQLRRPPMRNPRNEPLGVTTSPKRAGAGDGPERRCVLTGRQRRARRAGAPGGLARRRRAARRAGQGARAAARGSASTARRSTEALAKRQAQGARWRARSRAAALAIPADLPELAEKALVRALLDRLGLEMRAGRLILGSDRIADEARMGKVAALYHAADASEDGSRKLDQALRVGQRCRRHWPCGHSPATGPRGSVCGIGPRQCRPPGAGRSRIGRAGRDPAAAPAAFPGRPARPR